ncbi:MAG: hypothetical protein KAR06_10875, partial [Deltaproteobacteria bacterium]|nr:hypothetical protein [Deltaproteobacteria bacterium]
MRDEDFSENPTGNPEPEKKKGLFSGILSNIKLPSFSLRKKKKNSPEEKSVAGASDESTSSDNIGSNNIFDDETPVTDDYAQNPDYPAPADEPVSAGTGGSLSGIGELIKASFAAYAGKVIPLTITTVIMIIMYMVPVVAAVVLSVILVSIYASDPTVLKASVGATMLLGITLALLGGSWGYSALYLIAADRVSGIKEALSEGKGKIWGYLWIITLMTLVVTGASVFLLIPGIIAIVFLLPCLTVLYKEDVRGMSALVKSYNYVKGHGISVFVRLLVFFILILIISMVAGMLSLLTIGISNIALNLFITPFAIVFSIIIYND